MAKKFQKQFSHYHLDPKIAVFFLSLFSQCLNSNQTITTHLLMRFPASYIDHLADVDIVIIASLS